MIYQLANGKCIEISLDFYLSMTDQDEQSLIAMDSGFVMNNPFGSSVLKSGELRQNLNPDEIHDDSEFDEDEDKYQSMQDISEEEKINDRDFISDN